jgi:hypothetical protein
MFCFPVATWIGNAAAVLGGRWGAVSQRAQAVGCSREAVYQQRRRVEQAVAREQSRGPCYDEVCAENQRLRAENEALWAVWTATEALPEAKQQEFAATGSAMGLSLTQIVTLFGIIMAQCRVPSRATVGRWVAQTNERAGGILAVLDQACQALVMILCLDEIFFHHDPVLVAVEPHSMAWVAGQRGPDRTGETWCALLKAWPNVERVVSDAGTGLARGVKLRNEARATTSTALEQTTREQVQSGLDVFHTERERQRVVSRRWAGAAKRLETASKADEQVAQAQRHGIDARAAAGRARQAWNQAERVFDHAEQAAQALARIKAALALRRPDGQLNDRAWAQQQITDTIGELEGDEWGKVRRLLGDVRTLTHLDWMHEQLAHAVPEPLLREAVTRLRYWRGQMERTHGIRQAQATHLVIEAQMLCQRLSPEWPTAYARVGPILSHTVRASSAVECMHSVLRMHQGRHRHVSQGMLDLKRVFWNCRPFLHGKRRGACPYQLLGLNLPTDDWWELLQMEPEALRQKLSTQEVAA